MQHNRPIQKHVKVSACLHCTDNAKPTGLQHTSYDSSSYVVSFSKNIHCLQCSIWNSENQSDSTWNKRPQFQKYNFVSVAQQPSSGPGHLTFEVCTRHTEAATFTAHNKQNKRNRRNSIPSARFDPAITAIKRLQTYVLDSTANDIVSKYLLINSFK